MGILKSPKSSRPTTPTEAGTSNSENITNIDTKTQLQNEKEPIDPEKLANNELVQQTFAHPLGDALFSTMSHSKCVPKEDDVMQMAKRFVQFLQHNDYEMDKQQQDILNKIDQKIFDNHMKDFTSTSEDIRSPDKFNSIDVLSSDFAGNQQMHLLNLVRYAFPKRKFLGGQDDYNVIEFLENLNHAQSMCMLSENEFKRMMINATAGDVHDTLRDYFAMGMSVKDAYNYLKSIYHKPKLPDMAMQDLLNFTIHKNQSLADVSSKIMKLANRASFLLPSANRLDCSDNYGTQFLIRSLPHESQQLARKIFSEMSIHNNNKSPTFIQFCRALEKYSVPINADIQRNAYGSNRDSNKQTWSNS